MRMTVRHAYYRESLRVCQLKLCDYGTLSLPGFEPCGLGEMSGKRFSRTEFVDEVFRKD